VQPSRLIVRNWQRIILAYEHLGIEVNDHIPAGVVDDQLSLKEFEE
jgi:hypothetical protein